MRYSEAKTRFIYPASALALMFCLAVLLPAHTAHAARLYFDPEEKTVGVDQAFRVGLLIDSLVSENAFDIKIRLPDNLEVVDTYDGNSIINYWITRPTFDKTTSLLSFSGIVPGGYSGNAGQLLVMSLKATRPGDLYLDYDPTTTILMNDALHSNDLIRTVPLSLTAVAGKDNIENAIPDNDSPESFVPYIATSSLIFSGRLAIYFEAQDKGTGIYGYEVVERSSPAKDLGSLPWGRAESPYLLRDQSLSSYIYIRATDKSGNVRVELIKPGHTRSWSTPARWSIIVLSILLLSLWLNRSTKRHTRS